MLTHAVLNTDQSEDSIILVAYNTYILYNYVVNIDRKAKLMYLFDWDENKNSINLKKHGIDFDEASTVFFDERAILFDDPEHSDDEERFILLGMSESAKVCIVCHCYRESDTVIRIISARKATRKEEQRYAEGI